MIARRRDVASTCFRKSGLPGTSSILLMFGSIFVCVGCYQSSKELQPGESPMSIEVTSTAFQPGMIIPKQYTGDVCVRSVTNYVGPSCLPGPRALP